MESTRAVFNHEYGPVADAACSFCIICSHRLMLRTGGCQWKSFCKHYTCSQPIFAKNVKNAKFPKMRFFFVQSAYFPLEIRSALSD